MSPIMNDIYSHLGPNVTPLKLFETNRDTWKLGDAIRIEEMLIEVAPELAKRRSALEATEQLQKQLGESIAEVNKAIAEGTKEYTVLLRECMDEGVSTGAACNFQDLGSRLQLLESGIALRRETGNLVTYRLIPGARLQHRKDMVALREILHLEAQLRADHSEASTMEALQEVFECEGRLAVIGAKTCALRAIEAECKRQVALAKQSLLEERNRQGTVEQQRIASGQLTRAEIAVSATCYE